jgi:hypothetical protein
MSFTKKIFNFADMHRAAGNESLNNLIYVYMALRFTNDESLFGKLPKDA